MTDIWVCSTCHSINRQRNPKCYKCGASQEAATRALGDLRVQRALQTRTLVPYRSSWLRFCIAAVLIVTTAVLGVIVLVASADVVDFYREQIPVMVTTGQLDTAGLIARASDAFVAGSLRVVAGLGALVFFAAWLSRVTMNIPALGGGIPGTTPTKAFIYPLIPIWNLFKVPAMVQDALYRLDPKAGGFFLFVVAWVGLVGSAIVSFLVDWWVNLRIGSVAANATSIDQFVEGVQGAFDVGVLVSTITTIAVSIGAVVLVVVMFQIERRARARNLEIRGASAETVAGAIDQIPMIPDAAADAAALGAAAVAAARGLPAAEAAARADAATEGEAATEAAGPHVVIEIGDGRIRATLDGETEELTVEGLRRTAEALARVDGRATIRQGAIDDQTGGLAHDALQVLRDAGVPTVLQTT